MLPLFPEVVVDKVIVDLGAVFIVLIDGENPRAVDAVKFKFEVEICVEKIPGIEIKVEVFKVTIPLLEVCSCSSCA